MSRIQDLKKVGDNGFNIIDLLSIFNSTGKSKYVETLLRIVKNKKSNIGRSEYMMELKDQYQLSEEFLNGLNNLQLVLYANILPSLMNGSDATFFKKFCELNERGLIEQNDLSTYNSFEQITTQLTLAELKENAKDMEGSIIKLHDDSEWLIVKPLTFAASKKYGAFTKWCTTSRDNPEYFVRYTNRGSLIYIINKKTGLKVACFKSFDENEPEFSFWNSIDLRVDSLESGLPNDILNLIVKDITENPLPNVSYLTLEQKIKEESFFSKFIKDVSRYNEHEVANPTMRVVEEVEYRDEVEELFVNNNYEEGILSLNRA
jgi:hypothetical protein